MIVKQPTELEVRMGALRTCIAALVVALCFLGSTNDAHAQWREAYSTISFAGGLQQDAREGLLHTWWTPQKTREVFVSTPFYLGHLELGFSPHRFEPADQEVPAFDAYFGYAAWDIGVRFPKQVRLAAGPRLGVYFMDFDVDTTAGVRTETEMGFGGHVRLTVHPVWFVGVYAGASFFKMYTYEPIRLYQYSAGLVLTLRSPRWLKTVLR